MAGFGGAVALLNPLHLCGKQSLSMTMALKRMLMRFRSLSQAHDVPRLRRYAVVAVGTGLAVFFTGNYASSYIARGAPSFLFLVVILSSWYGGLGPGLLSVVMVVAGSEIPFPAHTPDRSDDWLQLILLTALAILLSSIRFQRKNGPPALSGSAFDPSRVESGTDRNLSARILESFRDTAIAGIDTQERFVYVNQEAARLLHRTAADVLGKSVLEMFPGVDGTKLVGHFQRAVKSGEPVHFEHYVEHEQRWYAFHCHSGGGDLVLHFSDITESKKLEAIRPLPLWDQDSAFKRIFDKIDYTLVDHARCYVLHQFAKQASALPGDLAEVGVYKGGTAKLLALTTAPRAKKIVHLFDTFSGMPPADAAVDCHHDGDLGDTSLQAVQRHLRDCNNVRFYPGFFPDTAGPIENLRFCLVHVDADIYQSVKDSCIFFYPRLESGAIMVFDDYGFPSCPGARKAVDEFFSDKEEFPLYLPSGQCFIVRAT
jgi:O-methyltransferase